MTAAAERLWELWKNGHLAECEISAHPLRFEIRCYMRGDLFFSRIQPTKALALAQPDEQRQTMMAEGWLVRPPMPD